jgi:superfamily I DNA and/or RNA helicase
LPLQRGHEAVLHPRFTDANVDRIIDNLARIDRSGDRDFLSLIRTPCQFAQEESLFSDNAARSLKVAELTAGFTRSQMAAFSHVLNNRLSLIWGPPGTGKTHFLAKAILSMAKAAEVSRRPFRVAVTAFTHAAVENLLVEIRDHAALFGILGDLDIFKLKFIATSRAEDIDPILEIEAAGVSSNICVIGGTIYSLFKTNITGGFPMLVVDEASQMKFGELAMALKVLAPQGKLVLAGDDLQLPPIMKGVYPETKDGLAGLDSSIFAYLRARDDKEKPYTQQLTDNWRMNQTLSDFPAETLYGTDYQPATESIKGQRIVFRDKAVRGLSPDEKRLCEWIAAPEYPMTLCILEGIRATVENKAEAGLVAKITQYLRERLIDPDTGAAYPDTERGDTEFWRRGLFIVSPHHAQIRAIRRELSTVRQWKDRSFVDTVDKMQGQQSYCVIVSYGVSDIETALGEAEFIYSLNRINVSVSRARSKCIVFLPRPLLEPSFDVLQNPEAVKGLEHMHALLDFCSRRGEKIEMTLDLLNDGSNGGLTIFRAK